MNESHLDTRQAATYLGISADYLFRLRSRGEGPRFARLGRRVLYRRFDLDRWVEANVVGTGELDRAKAS